MSHVFFWAFVVVLGFLQLLTAVHDFQFAQSLQVRAFLALETASVHIPHSHHPTRVAHLLSPFQTAQNRRCSSAPKPISTMSEKPARLPLHLNTRTITSHLCEFKLVRFTSCQGRAYAPSRGSEGCRADTIDSLWTIHLPPSHLHFRLARRYSRLARIMGTRW